MNLKDYQHKELHSVLDIHSFCSLSYSGPHIGFNLNTSEKIFTKRVYVEKGIVRRRSIRDFSSINIDEMDVSKLISLCLMRDNENRSNLVSAGNIQGLRLMSICSKTGKIINDFELLEEIYQHKDKLRSLVFNQFSGEYWIFIFYCSPLNYISKYGVRGYRYMLLEAGHLGEILLKNAQSLGYSVCPIGAFNDCLAENIVGEYEKRNIVLYMFAVGNNN